jgi:poly(glycerol-phosphate) alpha-glucosyltransferase
MPHYNANPRIELEKKSAVLKNILYDFIKKRELGTAGNVLDSYAAANPSDPDIKSIRGMIEMARAEEQGGTASGRTPLPDKMTFLANVETIFIMTRMFIVQNGIMNSVLRKAKLMEEHWGYNPMILICDHNIELHSTELLLRGSWDGSPAKLRPRTKMLGVYDYFQGSYAEGLENKAVFEKAGDGTRYEELSQGVYDVYDGDVLVRKEYFNGYDKCLRLVERIEDGKRTEGLYYDDWGYKNHLREYDGDESHVRDSYYTTSGSVCIKAFSKRNDEGGYDVERLTVYDEDGGVIKECAGNAELAALCLERLMTDDRFYMLVVENGLVAQAAVAVEKRNAARVIVVHNKFLENAYDLRSNPQRYYRYMCENSEKFDGIVLLTHEARNDFFKKYGNIRNLFAISHPYPNAVSRADFDKRDHRKAVIVARLDPFKELPNAIEIFADVVKALPGVTLDIYGVGSEWEACEKKIKELEMEDSVFLKGFTQNPAAVLSSSAMFMMTSSAEGFPLSLTESICNGCPIFAFDIKYGPGEVVADGVTGYLIPAFDKALYVERLTAFFEDIELQRAMSENCYTEAPRFGADVFLESWYNLTETLYRRRLQSKI